MAKQSYWAKQQQLVEWGWHEMAYGPQPLWLHPRLSKKNTRGVPILVCTREAYKITINAGEIKA